jgi:hypothetical protein
MWKENINKQQQQQRPHYGRRPSTADVESVCPTDGADTVLDRLEAYERVVHPTRNDEEQQLVAALALRNYHLPKHNWFQDWLQYFRNNHPVLGILCHYRVHPVKVGMRLLFLFGSIMFGVIITNFMWIWLKFEGANPDRGDEGATPILIINLNDHVTISITREMLVLWTVGGGLHAVFDNTIWYFSVCVCCLNSKQLPRFKCCASYCIALLIVSLAAMATFAVLLRTALENTKSVDDFVSEESMAVGTVAPARGADGGHGPDKVQLIRFYDASAYDFLMSYATEFFLALFVYYPIIGTILFSGCLGCGSIPIIGGRPYEVKLEQRQKVRFQGHVL